MRRHRTYRRLTLRVNALLYECRLLSLGYTLFVMETLGPSLNCVQTYATHVHALQLEGRLPLLSRSSQCSRSKP